MVRYCAKAVGPPDMGAGQPAGWPEAAWASSPGRRQEFRLSSILLAPQQMSPGDLWQPPRPRPQLRAATTGRAFKRSASTETKSSGLIVRPRVAAEWPVADDDFIAVRLRRGRRPEWALSPDRTVAVLYARPRGYKPTITAETCALRRRPFVIAHASDTDIPRLGLPPTAVCQRLVYEPLRAACTVRARPALSLVLLPLRRK